MDIDDFQKTIKHIPLQEKRAFVLHDVLGFKYREIALILNIKVNSVGVYIHRAREAYFSEDPSSSCCTLIVYLYSHFLEKIFAIKRSLIIQTFKKFTEPTQYYWIATKIL